MATLKKFASYGGVAVALAILAVFVMPTYRQGEASIAGQRAEDFAIQLDGKPAHLSDLQGKVVVLNFWATWCPPCVDEMPSLVQMQQKMKSKGVEVLAVSVDADQGAYQKFLKDHNIDLLTVRDPDQKSNNLYGTFKFPETYIIDRRGILRRKFIGPLDWGQPEIVDYLSKL